MSNEKTLKLPVNPFALEDLIRHLSEMDPNYLLRRAEVAAFLRISLQTLYRRCKKNDIDYVRTERRIGIPVRVVLEYIAKSLIKNAGLVTK